MDVCCIDHRARFSPIAVAGFAFLTMCTLYVNSEGVPIFHPSFCHISLFWYYIRQTDVARCPKVVYLSCKVCITTNKDKRTHISYPINANNLCLQVFTTRVRVFPPKVYFFLCNLVLSFMRWRKCNFVLMHGCLHNLFLLSCNKFWRLCCRLAG